MESPEEGASLGGSSPGFAAPVGAEEVADGRPFGAVAQARLDRVDVVEALACVGHAVARRGPHAFETEAGGALAE